MDAQRRLVQFRLILSLASIAYIFSAIHAIQYSALGYDSDTTDIDSPDSDIVDSDSDMENNNTVNTEDQAETSASGKKGGRWSEQEITLLLDYVESQCSLNTARGLTLKKSQFNKARDTVKSKDAGQCHYKWNHVCILIIDEVLLSH